jgi:peptidoglycan lytic transglycosylase G
MRRAVRRCGSAAALFIAACGAPAGAPREQVVIPPGATLQVVADSLHAHGVIGSRGWFRLLARVGRYDRRLRSGSYALVRGMGARAALRAVTSGRASLTRLTVPEGFTLLDIAEATEQALGIPRDSVLEAARDTALLREFEVPAASFEGFLRPETYFFARGVPAGIVVREMAATFRSDWNPQWDHAAGARGLDRLAIVTLASIVEGEARADSDRPLIAAVFRNRMQRGMPLQADATILYAMQLATGERKRRLYEKDYDYPSPYNTYLHAGLPPGPVGAPSRKSLEAVANPAPVPYLYYVAGPDGRHIFSRTYSEHLRAVVRSRRR